MKFKKIVSAFTLIELLVTMVVVGMLSSLSIATYNNYTSEAKVATIKKTVNDLYRFTVLYARENDKFYDEISLSDILNRFGMEDLGYGDITYVALGKVDFYYQATLPSGETWTIALIPKAYAAKASFFKKNKGAPQALEIHAEAKPAVSLSVVHQIKPPISKNKSNSSFYAKGTPKGMDFFRSLDDKIREKFIRATSDEYVLLHELKPKALKAGFNSIKVLALRPQTLQDLDKDGIPDYRDNCPRISGLVGNNGCPLVDTDGDGVTDDKDECPKVSGDKYNYGCPLPDKDQDGVWDGDDKCPKTKKGIKVDKKGCPLGENNEEDVDNDGTLNKADKCPEKAGTSINHGCPIDQNKKADFGDMDGDGIVNAFDKCPEDVGIADKKHRGCPDK